MWHAVAMQQQRIADMKLALGPMRLRPSNQRRPGAPPPPSQPGSSASSQQQQARTAQQQRLQQQLCEECSSSDNDDDPQPQPELTLAQRMGLAMAPEPELTPSEWDAIAALSRERDASREPCVICQETFGTSKQVLLSCGHVFHKACLRSWERHSKSRCCPVCRKLHYRKHAIDDGANLYREECATRIQAAARGVLVRRATDKALRALNPERRRRYCERRLCGLTDELLGRLDAERSAVDELFAEIDSSVAASRAVLHGEADDWSAIEHAARSRGLGDCPVCLNAMGDGEALTLLSCTHVFHARCLASFERFSIKPVCSCPVCRATHYRSQPIGSYAVAAPPERPALPHSSDASDARARAREERAPAPARQPQPAPRSTGAAPRRAIPSGLQVQPHRHRAPSDGGADRQVAPAACSGGGGSGGGGGSTLRHIPGIIAVSSVSRRPQYSM